MYREVMLNRHQSSRTWGCCVVSNFSLEGVDPLRDCSSSSLIIFLYPCKKGGMLHYHFSLIIGWDWRHGKTDQIIMAGDGGKLIEENDQCEGVVCVERSNSDRRKQNLPFLPFTGRTKWGIETAKMPLYITLNLSVF